MAPEASAQAETDREIVVTRILEGPRKLVFDAFRDVDRLGRWWGPNRASITTRAFDFRPGGVWDATIKGPQGDFPNYVVWNEIRSEGSARILISRSRDGGRRWSRPGTRWSCWRCSSRPRKPSKMRRR